MNKRYKAIRCCECLSLRLFWFSVIHSSIISQYRSNQFQIDLLIRLHMDSQAIWNHSLKMKILKQMRLRWKNIWFILVNSSFDSFFISFLISESTTVRLVKYCSTYYELRCSLRWQFRCFSFFVNLHRFRFEVDLARKCRSGFGFIYQVKGKRFFFVHFMFLFPLSHTTSLQHYTLRVLLRNAIGVRCRVQVPWLKIWDFVVSTNDLHIM